MSVVVRGTSSKNEKIAMNAYKLVIPLMKLGMIGKEE